MSTAKRPGLLRRIFGQSALILNLGAVLWLCCCWCVGFISPLAHPWLALFTITIPFALAANVFFVFFWLLARHKWRLLVSGVALLASYRLLIAVFGWHFFAKNDMAAGPQRLKVMEWNIHGLGIFDRPRNNDIDDSIMAFIQKEQPDILCLPEFYTIYSNALKPYSSTILTRNGYKEFRFQSDNTLGQKIYLGTAVFSKYPLRGFRAIPLAQYVYLLECDMELPGNKIVRCYFTHLQSVLLLDKDKKMIEDAQDDKKDMGVDDSKSILHRLSLAYQRRASQADSAAAIMKQSPYPIIFCGDFNDLPCSYTYTTIKGKLGDAFADKGRGFGRTFNLFSPTIRIDHILYDRDLLHIIGYSSPKTKLSDHNPVIANFEVK